MAKKVQDTADAGVTEVVTPDTAEVAPAKEVTPSTPTVDANAVNTQIEAVRQKYEKDISKLKSTFQSNESKQKKEWAAIQANMEKEVEALRISTMDEEQRKQYESNASSRRLQTLEARLQDLEAEKTQKDLMLKAYDYFQKQGVPASELNAEEGYDELWNSGMTFITTELQSLKQKTTAPSNTESPAKPEINAPEVVTTTSVPAYLGTTWDELKKKYGDEETVYRLVETGQLDASIIPVPK